LCEMLDASGGWYRGVETRSGHDEIVTSL